MAFYATVFGTILKIIFIINQWKQPPDSLSIQFSPWAMTKYNREVKGKAIWGAPDRPQLCSRVWLVQGGGLAQVAETEPDAAPPRPGQTQ